MASENKKSELLVDFITTLDGYGATDDWPGWWGFQGPEYLKWLNEQPENDYLILMGANTYRITERLQVEEQGANSDEERYMNWLINAPTVVFSSTLQEPLSWPNARLVSEDAVEAVRRMKQDGSTGPMRTFGSLGLCRSLIKAGLVDRFRVVVFPLINGRTGYDRMYDGYPDVALDRVTSQVFDGRLQMLEYVPRVVTTPPNAQNQTGASSS
jgi:dihydrofolate reductase